MTSPLVFLKLGGSLLSDKRKRRSFRRSIVLRLAGEIWAARQEAPGMRLLLAHGGGGFAHFPAKRFRTHEGIPGGGGWRGFAETRRGVAEMNRRVLDCLAHKGLFPVLLPPCAAVIARNGTPRTWDIRVIRELLAQDRIPLIHGDAVLDLRLGFTILSTETLFAFLAARLKPARVILACDVEGVYLDGRDGSPDAQPVGVVDRTNIADIRRALANPTRPSPRSTGPDVTGGMMAKVERLYEIARRVRSVEGRIVSGLQPGVVQAALLGQPVGTAVRAR